ncbi:hypothetical protein CDAR_621021 [Caerostris darwini]|uniref:Uncharacterized protein n=1 Tax=Caerostris darwini TaxID=1538125 RepID=A0AAV4T1A5_9ARAC|nr:hypothetical protein CDAR_621021 [Caerostris darwini]
MSGGRDDGLDAACENNSNHRERYLSNQWCSLLGWAGINPPGDILSLIESNRLGIIILLHEPVEGLSC